MEEQNTNQPIQETKETVKVEEVKPQPNIDELQAEINRKEEVIKATKKELSEARKRGVPKEEMDAIRQEIRDAQKQTAEWLDDVVSRSSGEYEESKPQRKTYRQQFDEKIAQTPKPQLDPEAQKILDYLADEEIDPESDFVVEAVQGTKNLKDAFKVIKTKIKEKNKAMEQTEIQKVIDGIKPKMREEILKELGLTSSGATAPSSGVSSFEKLEQDYADGKISSADYRKARKEQGIL